MLDDAQLAAPEAPGTGTPERPSDARYVVGYLTISTLTFAIDIALLTILKLRTSVPLPLAIGGSYAVAYAINFVLNRRFNFRSHAPVGRQGAKFAVVAACDYALTVGLTTSLADAGTDFRIARLTAAACVVTFSYLACRWWVFRTKA